MQDHARPIIYFVHSDMLGARPDLEGRLGDLGRYAEVAASEFLYR
jgi:hypothetical protein